MTHRRKRINSNVLIAILKDHVAECTSLINNLQHSHGKKVHISPVYDLHIALDFVLAAHRHLCEDICNLCHGDERQEVLYCVQQCVECLYTLCDNIMREKLSHGKNCHLDYPHPDGNFQSQLEKLFRTS